jgi:RHS repeat-associated protein
MIVGYNYVYQYKDHLGNIRISYSDGNNDGSINPTTEIREENNYYPGGLKHKGYNNVINGIDHKYGYNGKEENDELGLGTLDYGARNYDPALMRWMNVDPLADKYYSHSPYNYVMNNPINAIDPDGRLVIFVNGFWGKGTGASDGGTAKHWGRGWISAAQNQIGDNRSRFYDGSADWRYKKGGTSRLSWNFDHKNRKQAGYIKGKADAASIVNGLERDSNGNITESIKFVTSSMGTSFSRGMSDAITEYVSSENKKIDAFNSGLEKNEDGTYKDSSQVKTHLDVNIEFTVDLDAFQGAAVGIDPNAESNYYMKTENSWAGGKIRGSTELGKNAMGGHHPSWAPTNLLPKGKKNPKGKSTDENPTN